MLEHNHAKLRKKYNAVLPDLEQMYALYKAMRGQREIRMYESFLPKALHGYVISAAFFYDSNTVLQHYW
jgi:hypothetical protein